LVITILTIVRFSVSFCYKNDRKAFILLNYLHYQYVFNKKLMYIQKKVLLLQAVINHTVAFATIGPLKSNKKRR